MVAALEEERGTLTLTPALSLGERGKCSQFVGKSKTISCSNAFEF
jgi:hypothetical protein